MMLRNGVPVVLLAVAMACGVCSALVIAIYGGNWPDSWPRELEPFRARAWTFGFEGFGLEETVHQIPFDSREEFEGAWPHILKLKSKGGPLILEKSPFATAGQRIEAGVCIKWPPGTVRQLPDGTRLEAKAPWPDSAISPAGELPEYVMPEHGTWVPCTTKLPKERFRARVDIILVVDGRVVDLNRLELPGETPIVDRRFLRAAPQPLPAAPQPQPPAGLHAAASVGNRAEVARLLAGGADVNARGPDGRTPLHYAAEQGRLEVVQLLLGKGADVNAEEARRRTPLHLAAQGGHREVAEALLKAGADVNAVDGQGWTPAVFAVRAGHRDLADLLGRSGGVE